MDILRFTTAGSVDDGKSTLIGRLLYDTKSIKSDTLHSISTDNEINLAHVTDGLRAERQQGVTIDVAYKFFATEKRKFIITDAPGHFEYTRNLVTGASNVDAIIILIDARYGITNQTRRHSLVASFLHLKHIMVAVNKIDLTGYSQQIFDSIRNDYLSMAEKLNLRDINFMPVSALKGDNVITHSEKTGWYKGPTLLQWLELIKIEDKRNNLFMLPVQCAIQPEADGTTGYAGKILSGAVKKGDQVAIYPQKQGAVIQKIVHTYDAVTEATAQQNVCIYLDSPLTLTRGDVVTTASYQPHNNDKFECTLCWLDTSHALDLAKKYILRINTRETLCHIAGVQYKLDVDTMEKCSDKQPVSVNQFARVNIQADEQIVYSHFSQVPENGRGVIIDPATNYTSGAFIID